MKIPIKGNKKFAKFLECGEDNPDLIAKNVQNEMVPEGRHIPGSQFNDLITNLCVAKANYNLTGLSDFAHALSTAKLSSSAFTNTKFKILVSPAKSPEI